MSHDRIETADETTVNARVFRLFSRDGTGACRRSLTVRFDWTENGWEASFYHTHGLRDAYQGTNRMTAIPASLADLAAEAMRRLAELEDSGVTGTPEVQFKPKKK
jgi:hypothetical protein